MGCNGSKQQQDVATGNTVTRLLRRKSAVSEGTLSSTSSTATTTTTAATDAAVAGEDSSKHIDTPPANEKSEADQSPVVDVEETKQSPACSSDLAGAGGEAAEVHDHATDVPVHVDHAGETTVATGSEDEVPEKKVEENVDVAEKEDSTLSTKDDDGESIGLHSMDFKEAISVEEAAQVEAINVSETNDAKEDEQLIAKESSTD